jgi:hypothetical protein
MRLIPSTVCKALASCAAVACLAAPAWAATVVTDANFNSGTFADAGLFDFSLQRNPTVRANVGVGGSTGLEFGNNGGAVTASMTIGSTATFSMYGEYNGNSGNNGSAMSFGWTRATTEFNSFSGAGTGVTAADTILVGLARTADGGFSLGAANGATGAVGGTGTYFGNTVASLTSGNWYRLEGTITYDPVTGTFTFVNVSLDDFGADGTGEVTANVLSGTGKTIVVPDFGTVGRGIFATNQDRGVFYTDNYYLAVTPEPTVSMLLVLGGVALVGRRRRPGCASQSPETAPA